MQGEHDTLLFDWFSQYYDHAPFYRQLESGHPFELDPRLGEFGPSLVVVLSDLIVGALCVRNELVNH